MRWPWRTAALAVVAMALGGCASLPFFGKRDDAATATAKTDAADEQKIALYEFDVRAPAPLRQLLLDYLDLARFQKAPKSDAISGPELDRLVAAAPARQQLHLCCQTSPCWPHRTPAWLYPAHGLWRPSRRPDWRES